VKHDGALTELGAREIELATIAARGRRRSLVILLLACVPVPFIAGRLNHDMSVVAVVPFVAVVGAVSYSWSKWMRRPEDSQSIAFAGLRRSQRSVAYRSLLTGRPIGDPIVLTIVESMHQHVLRTGWTAILAVAGVTAATVGLMDFGRAGTLPATAVVIASGVAAIIGGWWITRRTGQVLRSDPAS
jgi:hypothetical protein